MNKKGGGNLSLCQKSHWYRECVSYKWCESHLLARSAIKKGIYRGLKWHVYISLCMHQKAVHEMLIQQINMALLWAARSRYGTSITCSLWFPWTRGWPTVLNCTGVGMSACKVISKPRRTLIHGEGIHQLHSWWGGTGSMMDRCLAWLSPRPGPFSTAWEESIPLKKKSWGHEKQFLA